MDGSPVGYKQSVRPFEDAGPGTQRTRFGPRLTDHYYRCDKVGCGSWYINWDKQAKHGKRKGHSMVRIELDVYESLPVRSH